MAGANTRPNFYLPFPAGTVVALKSYVGHNPDHKKIDMYGLGWPAVVAAAPGVIHEHYAPGGIEIRHFIPGTTQLGNWFTTYMHMSSRVAVGTRVRRGDRVGTAGAVGTWIRHLHFEELLDDSSPNGDADTSDMMLPSFMEYRGGEPFSMPTGEPGLRITSKNSRASAPTPAPAPAPTGTKIYQGAPVPSLIRRGTNRYFGLRTGPINSLGGETTEERAHIKRLQQRLIACGFVTGVSNVNSSWADGIFGDPTRNAVIQFQRKHMPGTTFLGQVWYDDWNKLFNL